MNSKIISSLLFGILLLPFSALAEILPLLPEYLSNPYEHVKKHKQLVSPDQLLHFFKVNNYTLENTIEAKALPELCTVNLPRGLDKLEVHQKTSLFIRILLPSVIQVNNEILKVRKEIQQFSIQEKQGLSFTVQEQQWLDDIRKEYKVTQTGFKELLLRVDIIPTDLVLAQGIDESGWGTSHFAIEGNALYGQHYSESSKGTYLTTPGGHVKVASFDSLYHSTASYIHNLNTTRAYEKLRSIRAEKRTQKEQLTGNDLVVALLHYSTRGQEYVDNLLSIMRHHKLSQLNQLAFDTTIPPALITFKN